uniref:G-protein coupled receptors family 1 profile domain-containing protein n=1 Tax=Romanomermis culicivorax TaxID=13658 RepID=A0A915HV66_ROMCU
MDFNMDYVLNNTSNYSNFTQKIARGRTNVELFVGTSTFLIIIFMTLAGNFLVILSILTYKPLNKVQNYFLVSLAAADLCVAALVMPFHVIKFWMGGKWAFGAALCQLWLTCDILCCTASILNLCVIALDRYWAITSPISYSNRRTMKFVLAMIAALWILSILISVPPLVGWNDWKSLSSMESTCQLTEETGFVVFSASGSFFVPLIVMTVVYMKIFAAARQRLRSKRYHSLRQYSQGLMKRAGTAGAEDEEDEDSGRNIKKRLRKFSAF